MKLDNKLQSLPIAVWQKERKKAQSLDYRHRIELTFCYSII